MCCSCTCTADFIFYQGYKHITIETSILICQQIHVRNPRPYFIVGFAVHSVAKVPLQKKYFKICAKV